MGLGGCNARLLPRLGTHMALVAQCHNHARTSVANFAKNHGATVRVEQRAGLQSLYRPGRILCVTLQQRLGGIRTLQTPGSFDSPSDCATIVVANH